MVNCGGIAGTPVDGKCAYAMKKKCHQGMNVEQLPLGHVIHLAGRREAKDKAVGAAGMIAGEHNSALPGHIFHSLDAQGSEQRSKGANCYMAELPCRGCVGWETHSLFNSAF
jgi:hypothetical protein